MVKSNQGPAPLKWGKRKRVNRGTMIAHKPTAVNRKRTYNERGKWTVDAMARALESIRSGQMGLREAGRFYCIPESSIRSWLTKKVTSKRVGPPTALRMEEEEDLVKWCEEMQVAAQCVSIQMLKTKVKEICEGRVTPFRGGMPGKKWWLYFQKRHPNLVLQGEVVRGDANCGTLRSLFLQGDLADASYGTLSNPGFQGQVVEGDASCGTLSDHVLQGEVLGGVASCGTLSDPVLQGEVVEGDTSCGTLSDHVHHVLQGEHLGGGADCGRLLNPVLQGEAVGGDARCGTLADPVLQGEVLGGTANCGRLLNPVLHDEVGEGDGSMSTLSNSVLQGEGVQGYVRKSVWTLCVQTDCEDQGQEDASCSTVVGLSDVGDRGQREL